MSSQPGPPRRPRLFVVVGVLVLAGLPFVIAGSLLRKGLSMAVPGAQPGGVIQGRIVDTAGAALEDVRVEVFVVRQDPVPAPPSAEVVPPPPLAETHTDADGAFRCTVPPAEGLYRVYVGGGDWLRVGVDHSMLGGSKGEEPVPLAFELEPGCTLEAHFDRAGSPVTGGVLHLTRRRSWYALSTPPLSLQRPFRGGKLVIDGLPAMSADVQVRFDSGAELSFAVDLTPGVKVSRFTL